MKILKAPVCLSLFFAAVLSLPAQVEPLPLENIAFLKAKAAKGDAAAELDLGRRYHLGKGVPRDFAKAAEFYKQAADQGNAKAMYNLGYLSEQGEGVPVDNATAVQWFQKSAVANNPAGQLKIGELYFFGDDGLPKDYAAANKWLSLAVVHADAPTQTGSAAGLLGSLYENGWGVPADKEQAVTWYTKGADLGNSKAQSDLGRIYIEGAPIKKNPVLSYKWLKLAAAQGEIMALHLMPEYVSGKVYSTADIAEGNRLIKEYREAHHMPPLAVINFPMEPTVPSAASPPPASAKETASPAAAAAPPASAAGKN